MSSPVHRISILYVDDEEALLDLTRLSLEKDEEFSVRTALSASDALRVMNEQAFDIVVSDYQMPDMDGIEFLKAVRERFGDVPFILFTGRGREDVVIDAINNGADFYLQKGGDIKSQFAELSHKIRQAVARRRAEHSLVESEKRLSDIIDFLPDATFAVNREGVIIAWNRAIEEMTGCSAATMLGKSDHEYALPFYGKRRPILVDLVFAPDDMVARFYTNIQREGVSLTAETDLPHPRGSPITVLAKASPLYNREGQVTGAIEAIRDITGRKKAEDELRSAYEQITASEEELRGQLEVLADSEKKIRESEARLRFMIGFYEKTRGPEPELLGSAVEGAGAVTGSPLGYLAFLSDDESKLTMYAWSKTAMKECAIRDKPITYETAKTGLWGEAVRQRRAVITNNYAAPNPAKKGYPAGHPEIVRHMNVPVLDEGHIVLVAGVANKPADYTEGDVQELSLLMQSLWQVIKQRRTEQALRKSEEKYRQLVENVNSVILTRDNQGAITFINEFGERFFGYTLDELIGRQVIGTIVPPVESTGRDLVRHIQDISADPEKFRNNENENMKKDGSRIWMKWTNRAILDENGNPAGVLSVGIDITEKKAAENALLESHERYQALFELGGEAIFLFDKTSGTILAANTGAADMYGYTRDELLQLRYADLQAEPEQTVQVTINPPPGSEVIPLCYHRRKNGEVFPVAIYGRVFNWKGNNVQVSAIQDITVRQNTEKALIESEQRYRVLAEHAFDGVMVQDFSGTILYANPRIVSMFGFSGAEEILGQNALNLVAAESRTMVMRDMQNVIAGRGGHIQKYKAIKKDRTTILIESVGASIMYRGEVANIIALRDITDRERVEDSLRRANTKLNLLNSVTRHDVNNQVHALLGYIQLAGMQNTDPMVADFLSKAEVAGSHITHQLDFTRMYQDLGLKDPQWQDLRKLVDRAAPKTIEFINDSRNIEIFADPMLENVFVNLFDNAIRHGEHVTRIAIWCMEAENGILIVVEDNGAGVPLSLKTKIFDKGFGKHTGFGLFLAREVLAITGISILETGVHGKGARFEIYVPNGTYRIVPDDPFAE